MKNQLIKEKQNMTYLQWAKIRNSSGTAGSFLKAYSTLGNKKGAAVSDEPQIMPNGTS